MHYLTNCSSSYGRHGRCNKDVLQCCLNSSIFILCTRCQVQRSGWKTFVWPSYLIFRDVLVLNSAACKGQHPFLPVHKYLVYINSRLGEQRLFLCTFLTTVAEMAFYRKCGVIMWRFKKIYIVVVCIGVETKVIYDRFITSVRKLSQWK